MKSLWFYYLLFCSVPLLAQNSKFDTDSTKNSTHTYEGFIISQQIHTKKYGFIDTLGKVTIPYIFDQVSSFSEGLAPASLGEKFGFINKNGEVVIPMEYTMVSRFLNNHAVVYNDYYCGLINSKNDTILPFEFAMLGGWPDNSIFINSHDLKTYGVITLDNQTILENNYAHIKKIFNNLFFTKHGNKWQIRDKKGTLLTKLLFDEVMEYKKMKWIRLKMGDYYGMVDENAKLVIPFEYERFKGIYSGLIPTKKQGKWGFLDTLGQVIIPFKYEDADVFINGFAQVKVGEKFNIINKNGEFQFPNHLEKINTIYPLSLMRIGKQDSLKIYNTNLKPISPLVFEYVAFPDNNRISVKKNGKYGAINYSGKLVVPCIYDNSLNFSDGYSHAALNGKNGIIDTLNREIIPIIYDKKIHIRAEQGILIKDGKYGIYNQAKIVVPVIHEELKGTQYNRYITTSNRKYGLIDLNNKVVLPNEYDEIIDAVRGFGCKVRKGNKWGFIQKDVFKLTIPTIYDELEARSSWILVKNESNYGLISDKGKSLIPLSFDKIEPHWKGVKVYKGSTIGLYSLEGKLLLPPIYEKINLNAYPKISALKNNNWENYHHEDLVNGN